MTKAALKEENIKTLNWGLACSLIGLVHNYDGGKQTSHGTGAVTESFIS